MWLSRSSESERPHPCADRFDFGKARLGLGCRRDTLLVENVLRTFLRHPTHDQRYLTQGSTKLAISCRDVYLRIASHGHLPVLRIGSLAIAAAVSAWKYLWARIPYEGIAQWPAC